MLMLAQKRSKQIEQFFDDSDDLLFSSIFFLDRFRFGGLNLKQTVFLLICCFVNPARGNALIKFHSTSAIRSGLGRVL